MNNMNDGPALDLNSQPLGLLTAKVRVKKEGSFVKAGLIQSAHNVFFWCPESNSTVIYKACILKF